MKKLYLFWNSFEIGNNQDVYFFRRYSSLIRILPLGFWLIGPLSLVGIVLSLKNWKRFFLVLSFIFSYTFSVLLFFVNSRFRLPVLPFLIIFSCATLVSVFEDIGRRSFKRIFLALVLFLLFFALVNSNFYHLNKTNFAQSHFSLGNLYLKNGDLRKSREEYLLSLQENPTLDRAHLNLGNIYFHQKDYLSAQNEFLEELKLHPGQEKACNNLSVLYRIQGNYQNAISEAQEALRIKPYYKEAYINLALAYLKEESFASAESTLISAITRFPSFVELRFYLGLIYQRQGKEDEALKEYGKLLTEKGTGENLEYNLGVIYSRDDPSQEGLKGLKAYAAYNSGLIYLQKRELSLARENLIKSIEFKPDFAEAHAVLANLYDLQRNYTLAIEELKRAIRAEPGNPIYHYNLGLILAKSRDFLLAKQELEMVLKLSPEFKPAQEKLRLVDSLLSIGPPR